jgi:deoxyadenosine/deoxycytidine kinase
MKIVIDGNIGVGKSTQLRLLEGVGYRVKREPINDWSLDLFYKDQSRWALLLQLQILEGFHSSARSDTPTVYERCPISSNHVFWENLLQQGLVTKDEDRLYQRFYDKMSWKPDLYIYLNCPPEESFRRIQERKQAGDTKITLEYMKKLHSLYDKLLMSMPCISRAVNVQGKTAEQVHAEIISIIKVENELYIRNRTREEVPKAGSARRQVLCTPFPNMCNLS